MTQNSVGLFRDASGISRSIEGVSLLDSAGATLNVVADAAAAETSLYPDHLNGRFLYFPSSGQTAQFYVPPPDCRSVLLTNDVAILIRQDYYFPTVPGTSSSADTNVTSPTAPSATGTGSTIDRPSQLLLPGERMYDCLPGVPITVLPLNPAAVANVFMTPFRPRLGLVPNRITSDPKLTSPFRNVGSNGRANNTTGVLGGGTATRCEGRVYQPFVSVVPTGGSVPGRLWFFFHNAYIAPSAAGETSGPTGVTHTYGFEIAGSPNKTALVKFPNPKDGWDPSNTFGLGATTTNDPTSYIPDAGELFFGYVDLADYGLTVWPTSTDAWIRPSLTFPAGTSIPGAANTQSAKGEGFATFVTFSGTGASQAGGIGTLNTTNTLGGGFCPQAVAMLGIYDVGSSRLPAVLGIGDSIMDFTNDTLDTGTGTTSGGFFSRAVRTVALPYTKATRGSDGYSSMIKLNKWATRKMLFKFHDVVVDEMGLNGGSDALVASNVAYLRAIARYARRCGVTYYAHTSITSTTGGNAASNSNWTSASVQIPSANTLSNNKLNILVASLVGSEIDAFIDTRTPSTDPLNFSVWVSDGTSSYGTADGTHPSATVHGFMAVPLSAWLSRIATFFLVSQGHGTLN